MNVALCTSFCAQRHSHTHSSGAARGPAGPSGAYLAGSCANQALGSIASHT